MKRRSAQPYLAYGSRKTLGLRYVTLRVPTLNGRDGRAYRRGTSRRGRVTVDADSVTLNRSVNCRSTTDITTKCRL